MCRSNIPSFACKKPVVQSSKYINNFHWINVAEQFEARFKDVFTSSDKRKAHFNNLPDDCKVVDGAKGVWCNVLMFDAIVSLLTINSFKKSTRLAFNQKRVLFDCIMKELEREDITTFNEIMAMKCTNSIVPSENISRSAEKESFSLVLSPLVAPWSSMAVMQASLMESPHSKAKAKYTNTVALLTNHEALRRFNGDIGAILLAVVCRVLFFLPLPLEIVAAPQKRSYATQSLSPIYPASAPLFPLLVAHQKRKRANRLLTEETEDSPKKRSPVATRAPLMALSLQHPAALEEDSFCSSPGLRSPLMDFFFDDDCCERLMSTTLAPTLETEQQQEDCNSSSNLDTLKAYFTSEDDWLDLMLGGDSPLSVACEEASDPDTSSSVSSDTANEESFRLSADECSLLLDLHADSRDSTDSERDEQGLYRSAIIPPVMLDRQRHYCVGDEEVLDFAQMSGVMVEPPTPREWAVEPSINFKCRGALVKTVTPRQGKARSDCALTIPLLLRRLTLEIPSVQ